MKTIVVYVAVLLFVLVSCKRESTDLAIQTPADAACVITAGTYRGWCAGDDSLRISDDQLYFNRFSVCDSKKQKIILASITAEEKNELIHSLDLDAFKTIDLNACNVCADGTDYWVSVRKEGYYHKIRYGSSDSLALSKIAAFLKLVDKQKKKFEE